MSKSLKVFYLRPVQLSNHKRTNQSQSFLFSFRAYSRQIKVPGDNKETASGHSDQLILVCLQTSKAVRVFQILDVRSILNMKNGLLSFKKFFAL